MCVLSLAWRAHPRWRLVMAGNRDELHSREAAPLSRWTEGGVIAGRDLVGGGTWAGVSDEGRFAVVTNRGGFGPPDPRRASRGALVQDILTGAGPYARPTLADLDAFNPFNLITVEDCQARFHTNRPDADQRRLSPDVYGLSNAGLDEPWPKTERLKGFLQTWLEGEATDPTRLLDDLQDEYRSEPAVPGAVFDPSRSPIFIRNPLYGARCGTVVAIDDQGRGVIVERRFDAEGRVVGQTALDFAWPE